MKGLQGRVQVKLERRGVKLKKSVIIASDGLIEHQAFYAMKNIIQKVLVRIMFKIDHDQPDKGNKR